MQTFFNLITGARIAEAATAAKVSPVITFVGKINRLIVNPLITLMFAGALVYFLYGVLEFLMNAGNPEARSTGQKHIMNGLIGMFLMFGVYAILGLITRTIGPNALPIATQ